MGIIKALTGAIGGGLADSWLEVIESAPMGDNTVFTRGIKVRKGAATRTPRAQRIPCPTAP